MVAAVNPYLSFNGTCEAAFNFYKSVFGGEFNEVYRYANIPDTEVPESEKDKIMHMSLQLTEHVCLMGADTSEAFDCRTKFGDNITITICTLNEEQTRQIYKALSEGGEITMPLEKTFWADLYATFTDKFGVCWALNFMKDI